MGLSNNKNNISDNFLLLFNTYLFNKGVINSDEQQKIEKQILSQKREE